jgi:hypothetical protein
MEVLCHLNKLSEILGGSIVLFASTGRAWAYGAACMQSNLNMPQLGLDYGEGLEHRVLRGVAVN